MFRPNTHGWISRKAGRDIHGKTRYMPRQRIPLGVVRLASDTEQTTVRADSSASRGSAQEYLTDAVLLLPASIKVVPGDIIEVASHKVEVTGVEPRLNVLGGQIDHYQVGGRIERQT